MTDQLLAFDVGFWAHEASALAHRQAVDEAVAIAAFATATFPAEPDSHDWLRISWSRDFSRSLYMSGGI